MPDSLAGVIETLIGRDEESLRNCEATAIEQIRTRRPPEEGLIIPSVFTQQEALHVWPLLKAVNGIGGLNCEFYEGLVAKRADSPYPLQLRSPDEEFSGWIKHRWQW